MNNSEQVHVEEPEQEKRKYVKTGAPRDSLWSRICKEHNITNFSKGSPGYVYARALYEEELKKKKNYTPSNTISVIEPNGEIISTETAIEEKQKKYLDSLPKEKKKILIQ